MTFHTRSVRFGLVSAVSAALGLGACDRVDDLFGGARRDAASSGSVTGFGSVFVNGVEWSTNRADIRVDDGAGNESDLRAGALVTVRGTLDSDGLGGSADSVVFDNEVEGAIASLDLTEGSFVVLGQNVLVSADTSFDNGIPAGGDGRRDLADLAAGDVVEVSGYRDSADAIRATRIGSRDGSGADEVKGFLRALGSTTFRIGGLTVDYAGATLQGFGDDTLSDGDLVEARGTVTGGVLIAATVEREDDRVGEADSPGAIEGHITRFASATDFDVAGVRVRTNSSSEFTGGGSSDLALDVKVGVVGEFDDSGRLLAEDVNFRVQSEDADAAVVGNAALINPAAGTVTLLGVNIVVRVNAASRLEDKSSAAVRTFSLADLRTGDHIEVWGEPDASTAAPNDLLATRFERHDADEEFVLRGPVQAVNQPEINIAGVRVATDIAVFRNQNDAQISEATFFAIIAPGDVVTARTTADQVGANVLVANEVEIEELP